ncbi:MAG TPA: EAL domain-containing protein [Rugosimonospora sp.]|nr:EAL domain-containing protein [Rugosimonospora sp.]
MGPVELAELLRPLAATVLDVAAGSEPSGVDGGAAREAGAELVRAHLTDVAVLRTTLTVLAGQLPDGGPSTVALAALAEGYAAALRDVTLVQQERLARAIIGTQARTERAARASEARFRAIFAGAAVGIGISDDHGRIIQVNQALADMLGYPADEMRGLTVPEMAHPSDPPRMWEMYAQMARGEVDHVRMEKAYYRKDRTVVWTDLTVSLIRDESGAPQFNVAMMEDITDRHNLQARLRHQALHDPLTGLPNRTLFADRLAEIVRGADHNDRVGVCYLDLDGFKRINDTLGHDVGDQLLVALSERLGECASSRGHLAARMGGDEFVILVARSTGTDELTALAQAALAAVAAPVSVGPHRLRVSASVGVVERPAYGAQFADILKAADVTLYRAKAQGRGRWAVYDPFAVAEEVARYELSAALPDALDRGEFSLVYQPIVDLPGRQLRGLEALVRWQHPRLGLLTPDRFIGLAEETGLIVPLGRQVLREACQQAAAWRAHYPRQDLFVSVNIAAAQTHEPTLVTDVHETLAQTGLDASQLQLELTESALMANSGAPLQALRALADSGVRVAIDDFGTGYSNLAYLRSLPVHALKLPQPLIDGLREPSSPPDVDERIVDALVRLAHAIELTVTAEGVETRAQAERLTLLGCDSAQGWYIGPPRSAPDLAQVLGA